MEITRPTVMKVDANAFNYNVKQIQDFIGDEKKIMPVIKANGYGTYINKQKDVIEQFDIVAVATVDEAVEMRENGCQKEIFVLNQPYIDEIDKIIENDIVVGNICMDSFMADVTDIDNVNVGDDVYIWDNKLITLDEVAKKCHTINYEIMSTISSRVPRVFVDKQ